MHRHLREEARAPEISIDQRTGIAEEIDFDGGVFDAVVTTLVLRSVSDLSVSLQEILRVLRPGGRFVYIEHVAAPQGTRTRRAQRWIRPIWKIVGGGYDAGGETWTAIEQAGFDSVDIQHFRVPFPIVGPHVRGVGVKKSWGLPGPLLRRGHALLS